MLIPFAVGLVAVIAPAQDETTAIRSFKAAFRKGSTKETAQKRDALRDLRGFDSAEVAKVLIAAYGHLDRAAEPLRAKRRGLLFAGGGSANLWPLRMQLQPLRNQQEDILDASAEYLDRYEGLIGPYPFKEFTVLEAFFSSGFAFPTCTQIAGSQLSEYRQYRRHGYLDHELLHNWWGNGIFVDPRDGNWCEGLASYLGNYYGYVLDDDETGARKQLRNQSNFLSAIDPDDDRLTYELNAAPQGMRINSALGVISWAPYRHTTSVRRVCSSPIMRPPNGGATWHSAGSCHTTWWTCT